MSGRLAGKVALVSGGAAGCGAAAARLFVIEGASVGIVDRDEAAGGALAAELRDGGHRAVFATADVARASEASAAVEAVSAALGPVTALFNHAGTLIVKPFLDTTEDEWDWLMAVNVKSMFLMTRAVLPGMIEAGGGAIVCTSSISASLATLQRRLSGLHPHRARDARARRIDGAGRRRVRGGDRGAAGPALRTRRGRARGTVPAVGRRLVRHGNAPVRR